MSSRVFLRAINSLISKRYQEEETNLAEMRCLKCIPHTRKANCCRECKEKEPLITTECCKDKVCISCFQKYC